MSVLRKHSGRGGPSDSHLPWPSLAPPLPPGASLSLCANHPPFQLQTSEPRPGTGSSHPSRSQTSACPPHLAQSIRPHTWELPLLAQPSPMYRISMTESFEALPHLPLHSLWATSVTTPLCLLGLGDRVGSKTSPDSPCPSHPV